MIFLAIATMVVYLVMCALLVKEHFLIQEGNLEMTKAMNTMSKIYFVASFVITIVMHWSL